MCASICFCAKADALSHSHPTETGISGYRIINIALLNSFISSFPCANCHSVNNFTINENTCGLSSLLTFKCKACGEIKSFDTSTRTRDTPDVNKQFAMSLYAIGGHPADGERLLGNMNISCGLGDATWLRLQDKVHAATTTIALQSMQTAASQLFVATPGGAKVKNVTVSCDNTWQRRGFQSKNGDSTVLSVSDKIPAKVIDVHCASNFCHKCSTTGHNLSGIASQNAI